MKIALKPISPASNEELRRNEAYARSLGFPRLGVAETPRLAVVGGGPSIIANVDQIRSFDGEVWAINGAWAWCRNNGIEARFYSLDPTEQVKSFCDGAKTAMLALTCHSSVFECVPDIEAVDLSDDNFATGPTTASSSPSIALHRGHKEIHFFGCESSFDEKSHAYGDFNRENTMKVSCDGREFLTTVDMAMQAEHLGAVIRLCPSVFIDRSGGLLSSYVSSPDIDVIAATRSLHGSVEYDAA